jgi:hypothetical protein
MPSLKAKISSPFLSFQTRILKEIKIDKYLCLIWHSSYCLKGKMEGLALRKTGKVKQGKKNIY